MLTHSATVAQTATAALAHANTWEVAPGARALALTCSTTNRAPPL